MFLVYTSRIPLLGRRSLAPFVDAGSDRLRRRGEAARSCETVAVVKHCGLGGFPHEQMLKGFPDLSKLLNPKGGFPDLKQLLNPLGGRSF